LTYKQALFKRKIETAIAWPIVMVGKLLSPFLRPKSQHQLFIFAPSADIGGANMNNADLANAFTHLHPIVIFSKKPKNNQFLHLYETPQVTIWDLHKKIDYKLFHFVNIFYRGVIAQWINGTKDAIVIGGESLYFHKVFPWLNKNIRSIELTHQLTWFNYTQQFVKDIPIRVFSTRQMMEAAKDFYKNQGIDVALTNRMFYIDNMIDIPHHFHEVKNDKLEVVFIGRGSPEKRLHLIAQTAKYCFEQKMPVHFSFVGDVEKMINTKAFPYCKFFGAVKDRAELRQIQSNADVLILLSSFEGLPMAIIEMMALGKVIVSTSVNAIPDYIKDGENGFLIPNDRDERVIVANTAEALLKLANNRDLLTIMGKRNHAAAIETFGKEKFTESWKRLIESNK